MSLCGICDEKINVKGYKLYGCEFCPVWLHASCVFPNASVASFLCSVFSRHRNRTRPYDLFVSTLSYSVFVS